MHKSIKYLSIITTSLLSCQFSFADPVIELDHQNYAHCIEQLKSVKDEFPVILIYATHCPYAQIFLPTYKTVANYESQSGRAFFQYDFDGASAETTSKCLGISENTALVSPVVSVIIQLIDPESGEAIRSMPIKAWGGAKNDPEDPTKAISITPQELEHVIHIGPEQILMRAQLSKHFPVKQRG